MSAINVGSVSVDVLPDTSNFATRLRADLRDLPQVQIDVGADTTAARAAIDELSRNRDAKVDVNIDDAVAQAKLDDLSRDRTADLTIREHHVSDGGGGVGLLGAGLLAAPLLAPLGVGALGGIAGIATAGAAGAAGLGVLALALSGVQNAVTAVGKAHGATGAAAKTAAADMAKLTPAARTFAEFVIGTLQPALGKLKVAASAGLLPGLEAGLKALMPVMPVFTGLVSAAAKAMGGLFSEAGKKLASPFFVQFFKDLSASIGPNIINLGRTLGNIATGFAGLFQAFLPLGSSMGKGVADLTAKFADFATHLNTNVGFQKFLDYVKTEGPVVLSVLASLGRIFGNLLIALAPLGAVLLTVLDYVGKLLAKLGPGELLFVIGAVSAAVIAVTASVAGLSVPVLAVVVAVAAFAAGLAYAWQHSETFRDIVIAAFQVVSLGVLGVVQGLLKGIHLFASVFDAIFHTHFAHSIDAAETKLNGLMNKIAHLGDKPPTIVIPVKLNLDPALHTSGFVGPTIAEGLAAQGISGPYTPLQRGIVPHGARAQGGPVLPGMSYWVGENGPELLHATKPGYVTSHADSLALATLAAGARMVSTSAGSATPAVGKIIINNPVPEKAADSAALTMRRLQFVLGN